MGAARAACMLRGSALSALPCPGTSEQIQPALTYVLGVWGGRGGVWLDERTPVLLSSQNQGGGQSATEGKLLGALRVALVETVHIH